MAFQHSTLSPDQSNVLRGLAIAAVLLIHFLAFLPHIFTRGNISFVFVSLDQLSRFCVPLFLFLSAYGLSKKYEHTRLDWKSYLTSRLGKLIPLYILWSLFSMAVFRFTPWGYENKTPNVLTQLLFGQADFQLYFLPLIFQLYILFPVLKNLVHRFPRVTQLIALAIQVSWYAYLSGYAGKIPLALLTDRLPYVLCISWIGYFVLGIYVAQQGISELIRRVIPFVFALSIGVVILSSWFAIQAHIDPLIALRFTRLPVLLFATCACLWSTTMSWTVIPEKLVSMIGNMGKYSYILFLAHTMGLRIVYALIFPLISPQQLIVVSLSWIGMVILSMRMLSKN